MIAGLSLEAFTLLHVVISVIGIAAGLIVVGGMLSSNRLAGWTALFLATTILTSVTGFMFPVAGFTPAIGVGVVSMAVLAVAVLALYGFGLAGRWRGIYVTTALLALYLNVFVFVVQSFQKVSFLQPWAPTQAEPPFVIAQTALLVAFVALGALALARFHPERRLGA